MSSFTNPLYVEFVSADLWRLTTPFEYHVGSYPSDERVIVPVGYVTDFGTFPSFVKPFMSPTGQWGKATVVHDFLCTHKEVTTPNGVRLVSRKEADDIFLEAMEVLEVKRLTRYMMYSAVRLYAVVTGKK